jgi:hypothetical protein
MIMTRMNRVGLAILAAGLLCVGLMFGPEASAADKNACSDDIAKFCPNIKPGAAAAMGCLEAHESELSSVCKEYEASMGGKRAERREQIRETAQFRQACLSDMGKFCNDASPTQGGMLKCLNDHEKELTGPCRESMKRMMN